MISSEAISLAQDASLESLKRPPHSLEAEQSLLGGLMLNNDVWFNIAEQVSESDFYRPEHATMFSAVRTLSEDNQPCDILTVAECLRQLDQLDEVGGLPYLGLLTDNTPSTANLMAYAEIIRERSIQRQLMRVGNDIVSSVFNPEGRDSNALLDNAERLVFEIAEQGARGRGEFRNIKDVLAETINRIDDLFIRQGTVTGVATGFTDFDEKTSGLQRSDLVIVAGRPSMGKTAFSVNIAEYVALNNHLPVAIFSMEMPSEQIAMRLISSLARINQQNVRTGRLNDDDWPKITSAISLLSEAPLFIDDTPALTPTEVRARTRRLTREHGQLGLVLIDYLQLMQVMGSKENRATEVSEISRSLKALAKELNVPVLALSQLNRSLEQRPNKRPVMSDLRESGSIEQDADMIVFIYRDEVYNEDSADKGVAEIIIGKQRNGPIGTVRLTFLGQYTKFENFASDAYFSSE